MYPDGADAGNCSIGWHDPIFNWLLSDRVATESAVPYTANNQTCTAHQGDYRAVAWGFVSDQSVVPTVEEMKTALCEHGALVVTVRATPAFQAYAGGVFNQNEPGHVNLTVTLTGWDDAKQAWRIKNAWGSGWGEQGYMWIHYTSNQIGTAAAWVDAPRNLMTSPKLATLVKSREVVKPRFLVPVHKVRKRP
jgi:cathepsin L